MFCKKCGTEMSDNAKFCPKCGYAREENNNVQNSQNVVDDKTLKEKITPEFNLPYKAITTIGSAILYFFVIVFATDLYELMEDEPTFLLIGIGIAFVCVIIKLIFDNMQYKHLEYNFYATRVEYIDGFFNTEEKELKYKYVREVTMSQNIIERMFGIGTIRIFTNASSGYGNSRSHYNMIGKNGIFIHCVENVKEQYQRVKQIIDEGTPND